jgi:DNA-binding NtrC family response regulator
MVGTSPADEFELRRARAALSGRTRHGALIEFAFGMRHPIVLVVDDEPLVRWSVSETLSDSGYDVLQAGDALSALETVRRPGGADVVLLDLRLPDASDLCVLSMMRRLSPKMPIILMTAYGSETLDAEARSRGACAVINKPFDMSALPALVQSALS